MAPTVQTGLIFATAKAVTIIAGAVPALAAKSSGGWLAGRFCMVRFSIVIVITITILFARFDGARVAFLGASRSANMSLSPAMMFR